MPSCTLSARLGITRTRRGLAPAAFFSAASVLPAAIEITRWRSVSRPLSPASSASRSCGLTATTSTLQLLTVCTASSVTATSYCLAIQSRRSAEVSQATTSHGSHSPPCTTEDKIASAILPVPRNPIVIVCSSYDHAYPWRRSSSRSAFWKACMSAGDGR